MIWSSCNSTQYRKQNVCASYHLPFMHSSRGETGSQRIRESERDWVVTGGCSLSPGCDFASPLSLWSSSQVQKDPRGFGWHTGTEPTAPQTVMWQQPCGPNNWIWSRIILQWTSSHLSLDKLYWSLTINRALHQLAAMPLTARGNNRIVSSAANSPPSPPIQLVVSHCNLSRISSNITTDTTIYEIQLCFQIKQQHLVSESFKLFWIIKKSFAS